MPNVKMIPEKLLLLFIFVGQCDALYKQPLTFAEYKKPHPLPEAKAGKSYVNDMGKRVYEPKDSAA